MRGAGVEQRRERRKYLSAELRKMCARDAEKELLKDKMTQSYKVNNNNDNNVTYEAQIHTSSRPICAIAQRTVTDCAVDITQLGYTQLNK